VNQNDLENALDAAVLRLHTVDSPEARREAWAEVQKLHAQRTPKRIAEMERAKSLTRSVPAA
jgi:hypothetical protein